MDAAITICRAERADAARILELQRLAFATEAERYDDYSIAPMTEPLETIESAFGREVVLKAVSGDAIVGAIRGSQDGETCYPARLIVNPDARNMGLGARLMLALEKRFPKARRFEIFTGQQSPENLHLYGKLGYTPFKTEKVNDRLTFVFLEKIIQADATE